jgi:hypothetical protein
MKKKTPEKKSKAMNEAQLLELLRKVLPKATDDPRLAGKIYDAVEHELKRTSQVNAFDKFCQRVELPNFEPGTVADVKQQLLAAFGDDLKVQVDKKEEVLHVTLAQPEGELTAEIKVHPVDNVEEEDPELKLKFVPFPVCMPADKELIWMLAKRENMTPDEAGMALNKVEDDFWGTKKGQKLLRDRVERAFPEFISRVPAGVLTEVGLKRHYKEAEPVKAIRTAKQ